MYDQRFFASQLGQAALVSIAAMVTFALLASIPQADIAVDTALLGAPMVELA